MSKLDELKSLVSGLFDKAEKKETIESVGAVMAKIDELKTEQDAAQQTYADLLKDYKDVVLHQQYKPDSKMSTEPSTFDPNQAFADAFNTH